MKFAVFDWKDGSYVGRVREDTQTMECLRVKGELAQDIGVVALIGMELPEVIEEVALHAVELRAPLPRPRRNLFCVGKNYHAHAREFANSGFDSSAG